MTLEISVISDVICPWCFIGKRRLEQALRTLGGEVHARVTWFPFQLNPRMPAEGMDRRTYRVAKFGSWARALELEEHVAAEGASEGIEFAFERIARTPNTFDAHRLIWLAKRHGAQDPVVEALFRAYFLEGRDVGSRGVLADIAAANGIQDLDAFLRSGEGGAEVREEERQARRMGVSGVPFFTVNGVPFASGAQKAEVLSRFLSEATP
ncbi:MAG: DsbA family oxidoreductase [Acidobacteria bacterium]|nr:DsbA family oxidoreductase [Acidobacteriota bacterium]MBI3472388.1 DsbA family oxidoreductase [Candidatus Solibacter usitatus]